MILIPTMAMLAGIVVISIACQWLAWSVKLPAILFLLIVGIVVGPITGLLHPGELFGPLLYPMVSLSVAVILFEGSLTLKWHDVRETGGTVRNLVTLGLVITVIGTTLLSHWLLNLHWNIAALLGAISAVSGPTVIIPMLRSIRPNNRLSSTIRWEAILIDPIGAFAAVLVYSAIASIDQYQLISNVLWHFLGTVGVGAAFGISGGYALGFAVRRHWLPDYLNSTFALAVVLMLFVISEWLVEGSGLVTVTLMGIIIANMSDVNFEDVLDFKEHLSILLISGLFIVLAANVDFTALHKLWLPCLILLVFLQFVVRPISVFVCTWRSRLNWREKILLAWIAPRGIVAAAIAALFALRLQEAGFAQAKQLELATFLIIMGTVVFQSATSRIVAKLLGVAAPDARGFLIIGANSVARVVGKALTEHGYEVMLSDTTWQEVTQARMQGLRCYYGNPVSEHADRHLDLVGIGQLLALSKNAEFNSLACVRYQREFGRQHVYVLSRHTRHEKHDIADRHNGITLFADGVTYDALNEMIAQGAKIKSTLLTDTFNLADFQRDNPDNAIALFALSPRERLHVLTADSTLSLGEGWRLFSLVHNKVSLSSNNDNRKTQ